MRPQVSNAKRQRVPIRLSLMALLSCLAILLAAPCAVLSQEISHLASHPGAKTYRDRCASCHGDHGQGVKDKYNDTLTGTRSVAGLSRLIEKTMPEGEEGTCTGQQAREVAAYIFDAFYSPPAQAKLQPIRESLSRLTIAQYRNSITDLLGRFRPGFDRPPTAERGIKITYNGFCISTPEEVAARDAEKDAKKREELQRKMKRPEKLERTENGVDIHLGAESPDPARMIPSEFQIRAWGSLVAPETGSYEFIVKSENGIRLYVNGREPLIDAWVSTGPEVREEKKTIFLLGGRSYRLALELLKFKDKSASVELWWKPPHGILERIPASCLVPRDLPSHFVPSTPLPADDRSDGYERGISLSKEWDQATTAIALEVADHIQSELDALAGTKPDAPDRPAKLHDFAQRFLEAAFRRPINEEQRTRILDSSFAKAVNPALAVKRVVLYALKSPGFLYPEAAHLGQNDSFAIASRMALTLWDSIPDATLWKAASEGKLQTPDDLKRETTRMVNDPRTRSKMDQFLEVWLETERAESTTKDSKLFPDFNDALKADLRTSLKLFLNEVVWSDRSDYRELLLANHLWLNQRLGKIYGVDLEGEAFQRHVPSQGNRAGVLTHPYLLTGMSYSRTSSPIHRGVFLCRNIIGVNLKSPSIAASFEDAKLDPALTMREKVTTLTKDANCAGCHALINPLGFALENFDTLGRWRTADNNKPINPVVDYESEEGGTAHFSNARDIAEHAAKSPFAHDAFIRHLFHHWVKQPPLAFGPETIPNLRKTFQENQFNIRHLIGHIALLKAQTPIQSGSPVASNSKSPNTSQPTNP